MNMSTILAYLSDLEMHNNREWYHANKSRFMQAQQDFEDYLTRLMLVLCKSDASIPIVEAKNLTFKLVRDTRFSHDKSPYNPAFRAHIGPKGKLPIPVGYYIMIAPGGRSFLGGGLFTDMFKDATAMVRDYLVTHGDEWESIVHAPDFSNTFTVQGSSLKKVPPSYPADHPQANFLKNKSWYLEYTVSDEQVTAPDFLDFSAELFLKMKDFNGYLNQALADFQMPAR